MIPARPVLPRGAVFLVCALFLGLASACREEVREHGAGSEQGEETHAAEEHADEVVRLPKEVLDEFEDAIGWMNGKTRYWIGAADAQGRKHKHRIGDVGLHHYAFELRSRKDVDALQKFLVERGVKIVDPAGEYYDDYYAVFFLDPDGMKLEGMKWGEKTRAVRRRRAAAKDKKAKPAKRRSA